MKTTDAGQLRHRLRFQKPTESQDEFGHRETGWTEIFTCWGEVRPVGSNEKLIAFQMQSGQTHVCRIRYQSKVSEVSGECRIVFGNRLFNIIGVPRNVYEKDQYVIIDTSEGNADAR